MEIIYDKLVRDKILEKIIKNHERPIYKILSEEDYIKHLYKKV